jgi:uncharacterized protein (TIGR00369 family)
LTGFEIADPNYRERIASSFAHQAMMETMGVELVDVAPGRVEFTMDFAEHLTQQNGFLHAGALSTALDSACGFSSYTLMPATASILTIENKVNLLRPARLGPFRIVGNVVKPGRTIIVSEGHAWDGEGKLVATMTATNMTIVDRPDVEIRHEIEEQG